VQNDVTSHVADNGQLNLSPERVTRRTTVKAGKRDTVASIAKRFRLSASQIADWNSVGVAAAFKPGQKVVVYLPVKTGVRGRTRAGAKAGPRAKATARGAKPAIRAAAKRRAKPAHR
jgi:membrane-bound lytic murein transglycosylase D